MAQTVKHQPTVRETWVQSLGQKDPLEKEMVAHSSILDWRTPRTEELGGLQSMGVQRVGHSGATRRQKPTENLWGTGCWLEA